MGTGLPFLAVPGCGDTGVMMRSGPVIGCPFLPRLCAESRLIPIHTDVDECATGLARCAHGCLNTQGSFKCVCHAGYELGADSRQCYRELGYGGARGRDTGSC